MPLSLHQLLGAGNLDRPPWYCSLTITTGAMAQAPTQATTSSENFISGVVCPALIFKLVFDLVLNQFCAADVTGGADADADDLLALGIQTEGVVERRHRENLAQRNLVLQPFP